MTDTLALSVPTTPAATAELVDWLVRGLLPCALVAAELRQFAGEVSSLPRIGEQHVLRPALLRRHGGLVYRIRTATIARHVELWKVHGPWDDNTGDLVTAVLGAPVAQAAALASACLPGSRVGTAGYRALDGCVAIVEGYRQEAHPLLRLGADLSYAALADRLFLGQAGASVVRVEGGT